MRAIGKLPKSVLILEFIGMMLLAVALLSVSGSLSLPEPFSRPEVQILMIFLGVLLMLPAAVVVILQVAKRLAPQLMNRPPQYSRSEREKDNDANRSIQPKCALTRLRGQSSEGIPIASPNACP